MADPRRPAATGVAQRGFTLVEVLASFVVFALLFATMMQVLSGSLSNTRNASSYTEAALWAQSRMAAVGIDPPIEEGRWEGDFDDVYSWEIVITPHLVDEDTVAEPDYFPVSLFLVELIVHWNEVQRPRQAVFRTLRTATREGG